MTLGALGILLGACQNKDLRISQETNQVAGTPPMMGGMPPMKSMTLDTSHVDSSIKWRLPAGWSVTRGSGLRLATFHIPNDSSIMTLTFINGPAGELSANLKRWMKQVHVDLATDEFKIFIQNFSTIKNQSGWEGQVYDFSLAPQAAGLIVVQFIRPEGSYFLKLTTDLGEINQLKPTFLSLAQSLKGPQ